MSDTEARPEDRELVPPRLGWFGSNFRNGFEEVREEWKRLLAEAFGTFVLVLVAAGGPAISAGTGGSISRTALAIAPGLVVMALIYTLADLSGAHFNPAVTFAFALRRDFPWRRVPGYMAAQVTGAVIAAGSIAMLLGWNARTLGVTVPAPQVPHMAALLIETVLTAIFVVVVLGTASGAKIVGHNAAIAVGAFIAVAGLIVGPATGGSMNPARSLAPDLIRLQFATTWIYVVGPLLGAALGVLIARLLRRHRSEAEIAAAQGSVGTSGVAAPGERRVRA
ncbi:MAG TPA: aquaporin [Coriobacteriia bacterium]